MSSTFSSNLRVELMGNGTQEGTWGTTTNRNLGTVLEAAISGWVTVPVVAANQALTAFDGAADQARNLIVELTTTTGANFAVYFPSGATKSYFIYNSSAYDATVAVTDGATPPAAAGTAVLVPAGKRVLVLTDGTNVMHGASLVVSDVVGDVVGSLAVGTGTITTTNYTLVESGEYLYIKNGATNVARLDASGNLAIAGSLSTGVTL